MNVKNTMKNGLVVLRMKVITSNVSLVGRVVQRERPLVRPLCFGIAAMSKYRKIDPRIWNDTKFRSLSDNGKLVFLFILTHPHMTPIGGIRATVPGLAAELGWQTEAFREAFREAFDKAMVKADKIAPLIWCPNFLKYNRPESPNCVVSWAGGLDDLPECQLKSYILQQVKAFSEGLPEAFRKALPEAFDQPSPHPSPIQEQEQEQEQEQIKKSNTPTEKKPAPPPPKSGRTLSDIDIMLKAIGFMARISPHLSTDLAMHCGNLRKRLEEWSDCAGRERWAMFKIGCFYEKFFSEPPKNGSDPLEDIRLPMNYLYTLIHPDREKGQQAEMESPVSKVAFRDEYTVDYWARLFMPDVFGRVDE